MYVSGKNVLIFEQTLPVAIICNNVNVYFDIILIVYCLGLLLIYIVSKYCYFFVIQNTKLRVLILYC